MAHHVKVCPVRLRDFYPLVQADRLRIVGYRCVCSCGAKGTRKDTVTEARLWTFDHLAHVAPQRPSECTR